MDVRLFVQIARAVSEFFIALNLDMRFYFPPMIVKTNWKYWRPKFIYHGLVIVTVMGISN